MSFQICLWVPFLPLATELGSEMVTHGDLISLGPGTSAGATRREGRVCEPGVCEDSTRKSLASEEGETDSRDVREENWVLRTSSELVEPNRSRRSAVGAEAPTLFSSRFKRESAWSHEQSWSVPPAEGSQPLAAAAPQWMAEGHGLV